MKLAWCLIVGLLSALTHVTPVVAQDATTPGHVQSHSTIYSIGIEWTITGDANHNASVAVQYRIQGATVWNAALPLLRVDYNGFNGLAGSVLFLTPDTTYEIALILSDPDGGTASRIVTRATRPLPTLPADGRTFHVVPGTGGGDGSAARPFRGIDAAQAVARPGDIFLLHAGSYAGRPAFKVPGAPRDYVVWKAAGDGEVVLVGGLDVRTDHVWVEGVTIRDLPNGLMSQYCPHDVVISRNHFVNNHYNIYLQQGGDGWYIADNDIAGDVVAATGVLDGEGIFLNNSDSYGGGPTRACGSNNHTVAHNRITNCADGIDNPGDNVDIFGNDIFDVADDGIELDSGEHVRVWGNRVHNAVHNAISFQPQVGAPWYIIRNQLVINEEAPLKLRVVNGVPTTDRFVLLHNTIVNWDQMLCCNDDHLLFSFARNNLWILAAGGRLWWFAGRRSWKTDIDYDGFDYGAAPLPAAPFLYNRIEYWDLASLAAASGLEQHGIHIDKDRCLATFNVPGPSPASVPPQFMTLQAGCNAIDAGVVLPNINDTNFLGEAPDLGAYESGQPLPVYGPRPVASSSPSTASPEQSSVPYVPNSR